MKPRANPSFNSFDTVITHEGGRIVLNSGMQTRTSLIVAFLSTLRSGLHIGVGDVLRHLKTMDKSYRYHEVFTAIHKMDKMGLLIRSETAPWLFRLAPNGRKTWSNIRKQTHSK